MIYDSRDAMLPADRDHLEDDVEDHFTGKTTKRLQNWLNTYRGLFKKSISEAIGDRSPIYSELLPKSPPIVQTKQQPSEITFLGSYKVSWYTILHRGCSPQCTKLLVVNCPPHPHGVPGTRVE